MEFVLGYSKLLLIFYLDIIFLWIPRSFSSEYCKVKLLTSCTSFSDFWQQDYLHRFASIPILLASAWQISATWVCHLTYISGIHPAQLQVICGCDNLSSQAKFHTQVLKKAEHRGTPGLQINVVHWRKTLMGLVVRELGSYLGFPILPMRV